MVGGIPSPLKKYESVGKNYSQYLEKQSKCSKPTRFNWWDTWFQPPFLMGKSTKSTISLAIFNGFLYVYQRILFTFHCTTIRAWRPLTTRDPPATRDCPLGPAGSLGPISIWLPLFWKSNPRFPQRNEELWEDPKCPKNSLEVALSYSSSIIIIISSIIITTHYSLWLVFFLHVTTASLSSLSTIDTAFVKLVIHRADDSSVASFLSSPPDKMNILILY